MMACALTGHRDLPDGFDKHALAAALEEVIGEGYTQFYCGMAEGFDLTALECLVQLKERYEIFIEACIPFAGQKYKMSPENRALYDRLLPFCDTRKVFFDRYQSGCFFVRNRYMVDHADLLVAYCLKKSGGTYYTVRYAKKSGIGVREIFSF